MVFKLRYALKILTAGTIITSFMIFFGMRKVTVFTKHKGTASWDYIKGNVNSHDSAYQLDRHSDSVAYQENINVNPSIFQLDRQSNPSIYQLDRRSNASIYQLNRRSNASIYQLYRHSNASIYQLNRRSNASIYQLDRNLNVSTFQLHRHSDVSKHQTTSNMIRVLGWVFKNVEHSMTSSLHMDGWFHLPLAKSKSFDVCYDNGYLNKDNYPCTYSDNVSTYNQSDAVLFRGKYIYDLPLPKHRSPYQKWIFVEHEAPGRLVVLMNHIKYSSLIKQKHYKDLAPFNGLMNLTSTFTHDSDILRTDLLQYCQVNETRFKQLEGVDYTGKKTDKALVVWLVSDCNTQSKREKYVKVLQRYISVHVYGKCGPYSCGQYMTWSSDNCSETLLHSEGSYKFYLAFENSLCDEYVTEKLWKTLDLDIVPVVMGSANYTSMMPKEAFINALNFPTPAALAQYLHTVAQNKELYNRYIRIKNSLDCQQAEQGIPWECRLCKTLHDHRHEHKTVERLDRFWGLNRCYSQKSIINRYHGTRVLKQKAKIVLTPVR